MPHSASFFFIFSTKLFSEPPTFSAKAKAAVLEFPTKRAVNNCSTVYWFASIGRVPAPSISFKARAFSDSLIGSFRESFFS